MSALAKIYVNLIKNNVRKLEDVPAFLKKEVEELLKSE